MNLCLALIVATKDRPADLRRLLSSLAGQSHKPDQVIIVDASRPPISRIPAEFPTLKIEYVPHWPPSASGQRNAGLSHAMSWAGLIGFADDDAAFEPDAIERMLAFWQRAGADLGGAAFNIKNYGMPRGRSLKTSGLFHALGLYSREIGGVAPSGWQAIFGELRESACVSWLPSGAVVWRAEVLLRHRFDEFFDGYSYLEDLDFSYPVGRRGRLAVVADAGYFHYPSPFGRVSQRQFGRVEVRNRLYFVRKHGLSVGRCYLGIGVRFAMTMFSSIAHFDSGSLCRAIGNIESLVLPSVGVLRPKRYHAGC